MIAERNSAGRPLVLFIVDALVRVGGFQLAGGLPLVYLTVNGVSTSRSLGAGFGCNSQDLDGGRETFSFSATGR
jgi:hypothetical protein